MVVEDGTARGFKNFMDRIYGVELQVVLLYFIFNLVRLKGCKGCNEHVKL